MYYVCILWVNYNVNWWIENMMKYLQYDFLYTIDLMYDSVVPVGKILKDLQ